MDSACLPLILLTLGLSYTGAELVIDTGSGFLKVGLSIGDEPQLVIPNVQGNPWDEANTVVYYGNEAIEMRSSLNLLFPTSYGNVLHWEQQTDIWQYAIEDELGINPAAQSIISSAMALAPTRYVEYMSQAMNLAFSPNSVLVERDAILALRLTSQTTGVVIQIGHSITSIVPVVDGEVVTDAVRILDFAGGAITDYLNNHLQADHQIQLDVAVARALKEETCYVAIDYLAEFGQSNQLEYSNDALGIENLVLGNVRFQAPEILFRPSLMGLTDTGLSELAYEAVLACNSGVQDEVFANVLLAGGTSMFQGMAERLQRDLDALAFPPVQVKAPENRQYAVWIGAAQMASQG